jgi:hypothetical protein
MNPGAIDQGGIIPEVSPSAAQRVSDLAKDILRAIDEGEDFEDNLPEIEESTEEARIEPFDQGFPGFGEGEDEIYNPIIDRVIERGTETIAFYKSFRHVNRNPAKGYWGIFFIKPRVFRLIRDAEIDTNESFQSCFVATTNFLYGHEIYHYKIDALCLQHEADARVPIYGPYRRLIRGQPISHWWEEAVANHYGLSVFEPTTRHSNAFPALKQFYRDLVAASPGAYAAGFHQSVLKESGARGDLATQLTAYLRALQMGMSQSQLRLVEEVFFAQTKLQYHKSVGLKNDPDLSESLALRNCPTYWISWYRGSVMIPFRGGAISRAEMINGYIERYLRGSRESKTDHEYYRIDNGEKVKIPNSHHKEMLSHEFKNILLKSGLTGCQFHAERKRTEKWSKFSPRSNPLPARL